MRVSAKHQREIKQGFITAFTIIVAGLTLAFVIGGVGGILTGQPPRSIRLYVVFLASLIILWLTLDVWRRWIPGFAGWTFPGFLIQFVSGRVMNVIPPKPAPRIPLLLFFGMVLAMSLIAWKYPGEKKATLDERILLMAFVLGLAAFVVLNITTAGMTAALYAFPIAYWFIKHRRHRHPS
jgi:hypothetical protein